MKLCSTQFWIVVDLINTFENLSLISPDEAELMKDLVFEAI